MDAESWEQNEMLQDMYDAQSRELEEKQKYILELERGIMGLRNRIAYAPKVTLESYGDYMETNAMPLNDIRSTEGKRLALVVLEDGE